VIDYEGGLDDLRARIIRAVGDPDARLSEDHLRALRAVRFAARLGFEIDRATGEAIQRHALELAGVSRERIGDEVRMMLAGPSRVEAIGLMESFGLDAPVVGEGTSRASRRGVLSGLGAEASFGACLAGWAVARLEPSGSGDIAREAEGVVKRWRRALCLSNDERDEMRAVMLGVAALEEGWSEAGVARRKRWAASDWFGPALRLVGVRDPGLARSIESDVGALRRTPGGLAPEPLITGDDLIEAGLRPGPAFAAWLDRAYDAQLEGRVSSREEALGLVRGMASEDAGGRAGP